MSEDERIYQEAIKLVDKLVEETVQKCNEVAIENHYDKDWVLDRFSEAFHKAKTKVSN